MSFAQNHADESGLFEPLTLLDLEELVPDPGNWTYIDVESTGLHKGSLPIEFGCCGLDLDAHSFLIKPRPDFNLAHWSSAAEAVHGIALEDVQQAGLGAEETIARIQSLVGPGKIALSDNAEKDQAWLSRLSPNLADLPILPVGVFIASAQTKAIKRSGLLRLERATRHVQMRFPHMHRAGPDSRRMAALFRLLVDDAFVEEMCAAP